MDWYIATICGGCHDHWRLYYKSFGNNYGNSVIIGILSGIFWNLPALHPKWEVAPEVPIRTGAWPVIQKECRGLGNR